MKNDDRNLAIGAAIGGLALIGFGVWAFGRDDEPEPGPGPDPGPDPRPSGSLCDLDGKPYNAGLFENPADVVNAMQGLGYDVVNLDTPSGKMQLLAFQRRAKQLGLRGYKDAPESYMDSIPGACTLRSVEHAMELDVAGEWPSPYEPL